MNKKFATRLEEYLSSECDDYGLEYTWDYDSDMECCVAEIKRYDYVTSVNFKYDEEKDELLIELSEDSFYKTREFDETVKYFWMLISPCLFPVG